MAEAPDSCTHDEQDQPWPPPRRPGPTGSPEADPRSGQDAARPGQPSPHGPGDGPGEAAGAGAEPWPTVPDHAGPDAGQPAAGAWPERVAASPVEPPDEDAAWPPAPTTRAPGGPAPRPDLGEPPPDQPPPPDPDQPPRPEHATHADDADAADHPAVREPLRPLRPRRPRRPARADETPPDDALLDDELLDDELQRSRGDGRRRAQPWGLRRLATLAAGLLVAALFVSEAWWRGTTPGFDALVRLEHLPVPTPPAADQAPPAGSPAETFWLGLAAYADGRWIEAEELLSRAAPLVSEPHPEARLYLASALLQLGRFLDAEVEALAAADTSSLRSEGWWLSVQARLQMDPPALAEARELLDRLVETGLDRADDARALRDAIDALR